MLIDTRVQPIPDNLYRFPNFISTIDFLGESGDEGIDVRVGTDTKMFIE